MPVSVKPGQICNTKGKVVSFGSGNPLLCVNDRIGYECEKPDIIAELNSGSFDSLMAITANGLAKESPVINLQLMRNELDERALLPRLTERVMAETDALIAIDSRDPIAIEECLKIYAPGKAMCNFINGEKENLRTFLPLVAKYGGAVGTALVSDKGIPDTVSERLMVARTIVDAAKANGIPPEDVAIDAICMPAGVVIGSPKVTLETIRALKEELGVPVLLGLSNVSYMLPYGSWLDMVFCVMCAGFGLDVAMIDPDMPNFVMVKHIIDFYTGVDPYGMEFISHYRQLIQKEKENTNV